MFREGTPAAKLYALIGLHDCDRKPSLEARDALRDSPDCVTTHAGCLVTSRPVQEVAAEIDAISQAYPFGQPRMER